MFIAHMSTADDCVCITELMCDSFNLDDVTIQALNKSLLENLGISTATHSIDKHNLTIMVYAFLVCVNV